MNKLEKILSKWNFKKIAVIYIIAAVVAAIGCTITVGVIYRERLGFAFQYAKLEDAIKDDNSTSIQDIIDKTAGASSDVVDILVLDKDNKVNYSAKSSKFSAESLNLMKVGDKKKYLASANFPDTVFKYVKNDEFMLNSILNKDFGKIREDYDDDSFYGNDISSKTVYMLSCIRSHGSDSKIYVISSPTSVPGGMTALKATAAAAMFFFMIYWVLIALWMYKDAAKSKLSPWLWGLIGLFTNIIGLIVYKLYKKSNCACAVCGALQSGAHLFCSFCGSKLGQRCENCGSKVGAKDDFCHQCGNKLE